MVEITKTQQQLEKKKQHTITADIAFELFALRQCGVLAACAQQVAERLERYPAGAALVE